jgi:hypothetical protein
MEAKGWGNFKCLILDFKWGLGGFPGTEPVDTNCEWGMGNGEFFSARNVITGISRLRI